MSSIGTTKCICEWALQLHASSDTNTWYHTARLPALISLLYGESSMSPSRGILSTIVEIDSTALKVSLCKGAGIYCASPSHWTFNLNMGPSIRLPYY